MNLTRVASVFAVPVYMEHYGEPADMRPRPLESIVGEEVLFRFTRRIATDPTLQLYLWTAVDDLCDFVAAGSRLVGGRCARNSTLHKIKRMLKIGGTT